MPLATDDGCSGGASPTFCFGNSAIGNSDGNEAPLSQDVDDVEALQVPPSMV